MLQKITGKQHMCIFEYTEITNHPLHQIEYSITDICNRNCKSCSRFAPLAKQPNKVGVEESIENTKIFHNIMSMFICFG